MGTRDKDAEIDAIIKALPSGSGFNSGWDVYPSDDGRRAVMEGGYQYLHPDGYYDGWVLLELFLRWKRDGFSLRIRFRTRDADTRRILRKDPELRDFITEEIQAAMRKFKKTRSDDASVPKDVDTAGSSDHAAGASDG